MAASSTCPKPRHRPSAFQASIPSPSPSSDEPFSAQSIFITLTIANHPGRALGRDGQWNRDAVNPLFPSHLFLRRGLWKRMQIGSLLASTTVLLTLLSAGSPTAEAQAGRPWVDPPAGSRGSSPIPDIGNQAPPAPRQRNRRQPRQSRHLLRHLRNRYSRRRRSSGLRCRSLSRQSSRGLPPAAPPVPRLLQSPLSR